MLTLFLVDLDNLVGQAREAGLGRLPLPVADRGVALGGRKKGWPGLEADQPALPQAPPAGTGEAPRAVVAFALNTSTARCGVGAERPSHAWLGRLAHRLGERWGVDGPVAWELALAPTVPQAADRGLALLLERAPLAAHAGNLDQVVVVSWDRGLGKGIGALLGPGYAPDPRLKGRGEHAWRRKGHAPAFPRRAPLAAPAPADKPAPYALPAGWVVRMDEPLRAGAARQLAPDLDPGVRPLSELARSFDGLVPLRTQLGLTRRSTRGAARLAARSAELGPVHHGDGVAVSLGPPPIPGSRRHADVAVTRPVPGAFGLGEASGTSGDLPLLADTRLPPVAVAALAATRRAAVARVQWQTPAPPDRVHPASRVALLDLESLSELPPLRPMPGLHRVQLRTRGQTLEARVQGDLRAAQAAWWFVDGRAARDQLKLRDAAELLLSEADQAFPARLARVDAADGTPELVFVSAASSGEPVTVTLPQSARPGRITRARHQHLPCPLLVLGPDSLPAGPVQAVAIQALSPEALADGLCDAGLGAAPELLGLAADLARLPLLVAPPPVSFGGDRRLRQHAAPSAHTPDPP